MAADVSAVPLQAKTTRGWRMGLSTMLDKELGQWFRTKTWLVQAIIWVLLANGFVAMVLYDNRIAGGDEVRDIATMMFFLFGGMGAAVGAAIAMQDAVIGERESGTAAWVLSKPLSRVAFIASKLLSHSVGMLLTAVAIPGLVFYVLCALRLDEGFALARLAPATRPHARAVLLRLVTPAGTRQVLSQERLLEGLPAAAAEVLDRLVAARLITTRQTAASTLEGASLELAHESLITAWSQL